MITVVYWMKGKPKDAKGFNTMPEARAFMRALAECENCEGYGIEKQRTYEEVEDEITDR